LQLEEKVAQLLGKEKGIFVPSGTMSNLIGVAAHTSRGDEIILGDKSHIHLYEAGGVSVMMSVTQRTVQTQIDGTIRLKDISDAIRVDDPHYPKSTIVSLENTQNACGGRVLPLDYLDEVGAFCKDNHLILHIDGARIFNAVAASKISVQRIVKSSDSVSVCLSKGLGAPAGSVLVGDASFVERARRLRKMVGGGMRQSGILCAAGIFALENNVERIGHDHMRAKRLANGLQQFQDIVVDTSAVETNMVYFSMHEDSEVDPGDFIESLDDLGVRIGSGYSGGKGFRAVTHLGVSDSCIDRALDAVEQSLRGASSERPSSLRS